MDCNAEADDEVKRGRAGMEKPNTAPFLVDMVKHQYRSSL
jgi:hypothetical protein